MNDSKVSWEQAVIELRRDTTQAALVRACFYDDPLEQSAIRYFGSSEWKALEKLLPQKKGSVLDLGAGRGVVSYAFARAGWQVTAVEPDQSSIVGANAIRALAATSNITIDVVEAIGERLPFPDSSFDVVHCRAVLHHAADLNALCMQVFRVLRPGGLMIATREHVISRDSDRSIFLNAHPLHQRYGGENAYRLPVYLSAITGAGLKVEAVLSPFESDINLFPDTKRDFKRRIAGRLNLPIAELIPDSIFRFLGWFNSAPGRLYTFIARKPLL